MKGYHENDRVTSHPPNLEWIERKTQLRSGFASDYGRYPPYLLTSMKARDYVLLNGSFRPIRTATTNEKSC